MLRVLEYGYFSANCTVNLQNVITGDSRNLSKVTDFRVALRGGYCHFRYKIHCRIVPRCNFFLAETQERSSQGFY